MLLTVFTFISDFTHPLASADIDPIKLQQLCMENCISIKNSQNIHQSMALFFHKDDVRDACKWVGVRCDKNGFVTQIRWSNDAVKSQRDRVPNLQWFPSSVRDLYLRSQEKIIGGFVPSMLPRELRACRLFNVYPLLKLPLEKLPIDLTVLAVRQCRISGQVRLVELPPFMKELDLRDNPFSSIVVGRLPESLVYAYFYAPQMKNPTAADGGAVDPRVQVRL